MRFYLDLVVAAAIIAANTGNGIRVEYVREDFRQKAIKYAYEAVNCDSRGVDVDWGCLRY